MADTALQTVYRDEWIAAYERNQSLLRSTVTTAADIRGEKAVFLVSASNREAVTRGPNGQIPSATGNQTQYECALQEWHDLPQKTHFDILRAQSDQRAIMISESQSVINRKVDDLILAELMNGTIDMGSTATIMTKRIATAMLVTLWNSNVPNDGNTTVLITPATLGYLSEIPEFASADYVDDKVNVNGPARKKWLGAMWMLHTGLTGVGTAAAYNIAYHKSAIGHAYAPESLRPSLGTNEEQDYDWVRASIYMNAKLLQNSGVVLMKHDDSAMIGCKPMAYDPSKLKLVGRINAGPRQWEYVSDDAMTTVRAAGYISDAKLRGMQVADQVRVVTTSAGAVSTDYRTVCLSFSGNAADLADGSAMTVTNS